MRMTRATESGAKRGHATPDHERLTSIAAVLADGELTPPRKLEVLTGWDERHGDARPEGHGLVAGAADLGFSDPAPYSAEVQRAIVELYRLHRDTLPAPREAVWNAGPPRTAG